MAGSPSFAPGDRVVLSSTRECGIVVHAWIFDELEDVYVAFFGAEFPAHGAALPKPPYVLRYAATSLRRE